MKLPARGKVTIIYIWVRHTDVKLDGMTVGF